MIYFIKEHPTWFSRYKCRYRTYKDSFQVTVVITFLKLSFVHTAFIAVYVKGGK
jgi:hypothetical protein